MQSTKPIVNIFRTFFMMLQTSFKLLLVPFQIDGRRFSCFSGCSSTFLYAPFHNFYSQLPFLWLDHSVSVCICDLTEARCTFRVGLRFATGNALGVVDVGPRRLLSTSPPCPALPWSLCVLLVTWSFSSFSLYF